MPKFHDWNKPGNYSDRSGSKFFDPVSGQPSSFWVWVWKISPINSKFFKFIPWSKKTYRIGSKSNWVSFLFKSVFTPEGGIGPQDTSMDQKPELAPKQSGTEWPTSRRTSLRLGQKKDQRMPWEFPWRRQFLKNDNFTVLQYSFRFDTVLFLCLNFIWIGKTNY